VGGGSGGGGLIPYLNWERIEVRVNDPFPHETKNPPCGGLFFFRKVPCSVHPEILSDDFQQMTHLEGL
jgi:hypothetical protein